MLKRPPAAFSWDTVASPVTRPAHHLAGAHKRVLPYSVWRELAAALVGEGLSCWRAGVCV
jgi:hypothetical protein